MTYNKFENWINNNKFTSILLIFLFITGILSQFTDIYKKVDEFFFPKSFKIESIEASTKFSIYRDISKVKEYFKQYYNPTQFSETFVPKEKIEEVKLYRQFNYYKGMVDRLTNKTSMLELFVVANANVNYALKNISLSKDVIDKFKTFSDCSKMKETMSFIYELVPPQRYKYFNIGKKTVLEMFLQKDDEFSKIFLTSLTKIYNDDLSSSYKVCSKTISRAKLEELLDDYYPIYFNYFLPVFEILLSNETSSDIAIDTIAVEVQDIAEYKGGGEYFNETKIINISVPYKKGVHKKVLSKKLRIPANSKLIVKVRLSPQDRFSSYLMNFNFYSGEIVKKTEIFAVDF